MSPKHVLVIDVASVGLHGPAFAVAGVLVELDGEGGMRELDGEGGMRELESFHYHADPMDCVGEYEAEDLQWVLVNVPHAPEDDHLSPGYILDAFWKYWLARRQEYPGLVMAAECAWPVEARFLAACVDRQRPDRNWEGPYPLHDIASIMLAAGMDPMAAYDRLPEELPKHDPLADARQSARLMHAALCRLDGWRRQQQQQERRLSPVDLRRYAEQQLAREAVMIPQQEQQAGDEPPTGGPVFAGHRALLTGAPPPEREKPVGLRPEWVWREHRLEEIREAAMRILKAGGKAVPNAYILELMDHVAWIKDRTRDLPPELEWADRLAGLGSVPAAVEQLAREAAAIEGKGGPVA